MFCRVGEEELVGGGGVARELEINAINLCFGVGVLFLGDSSCLLDMFIDEVESVIGQFAEVAIDGFVGTVDVGV